MAKDKLIPATATIGMAKFPRGATRLVDPNDEYIKGLLESGVLVRADSAEKPAEPVTLEDKLGGFMMSTEHPPTGEDGVLTSPQGEQVSPPDEAEPRDTT